MAIMAARRGTRLMNRGKNGTTLVRAAVLGGPAVPVRKNRLSRRTSVVLAALASLALGQAAHAQTIGNEAEGAGAGTLLRLVGGGAVIQPGTTPPAPVDFTQSVYGYIANPYMMVAIGNSGTYTLNYGPFTSSFNVAGILTFGNLIGSSRISGDDNKPLNVSGFGLGEVFPVPGETETTANGLIYYAYPSYLRAQVDGTNVNVVNPVSRFENSVLAGTADIGSDVTLRQEIRLYRTQAQMRWVITNADTTASHVVNLRFVVNHGGTGREGGDLFNGRFYTPGANFYENPLLGQSNRASIINGADVPATLALYGARYEDPNGNVYAGRHTFRGAGATPPSRVVIASAFEMRPRLAGFDITPERLPGSELGVASYFGPFTLAPGQSQTVITYYGNATPSDRLDSDFVTTLDGPEALGYNAAAASAAGVVNNTSATITDQGVQFLTPNPFQIFAGIYNRVPSNPSDKLDLTNVSASLTLPTGLALGTIPGTTTADTPRKVLGDGGTVLSDRGADTSWYVRPTGEAFGTLNYQVSVTTQELGGRQQTRSINIPAVPFRSVTQAGFQMIGFPFAFDPVESNNGDPATVVNSLSRPDSPVAFYQWVPNPTVPGDGGYQIVTQLQNGIGYMYRPQVDRTIFAKGVYPQARQADATTVDQSDIPQRQIILERGWNMISNPYVYDIPMRALRFATATEESVNGVVIPNVASQTFANANASGLIRGGVFNLDPLTASYTALDATTASLRPWEAYWIYAVNRSVLVYPLPTQRQAIVVPPSDGTTPIITRGKTDKSRVVTTPVTAGTLDDWSLQLVAQRNVSVDKSVLIGASSKKEQEAMPKPPLPAGDDYVYVGIVKGTDVTKYAKDIRTGRGAQTWKLAVFSGADGRCTLSWPGLQKLPGRLNLKIKDKSTGRIFSMRSSSSLTLNVTKAQPTELEVISEVGNSQPLAVLGVQIVPEGRATGGSRNFAFRITKDATVSATITTITGKTLTTVSKGRNFTRGQGNIHWDGRAQDGSILPPGPYRLELVAQDAEGNVAPVSQVFMTTQ